MSAKIGSIQVREEDRGSCSFWLVARGANGQKDLSTCIESWRMIEENRKCRFRKEVNHGQHIDYEV